MLSKEENQIVTRVGAGTPMGETLRRYWMPALLASEIPGPDSPPVRVRLLGEETLGVETVGLGIDLRPVLHEERRGSEQCSLRKQMTAEGHRRRQAPADRGDDRSHPEHLLEDRKSVV